MSNAYDDGVAAFRSPIMIALLALLPFGAASPASAQAINAGALQAMCQARAQQPVCAAYLQGYIDGRNQSLPRPTVCLPAGTSIADVANAFAQHVAQNRLEANLQAGLVLGNVLITTYRCK
jgi:hypothetical protein